MTVNGGNFINTSEVQMERRQPPQRRSRERNTADGPRFRQRISQVSARHPGDGVYAYDGFQRNRQRARAGSSLSGTTSNALTFTINPVNPVPTLTALSPSSASAGSVGFTTDADRNETSSRKFQFAHWNGAALATTFVSSTQLTAAVPASDCLAFFGIASVDVNQSDARAGGTSDIR